MPSPLKCLPKFPSHDANELLTPCISPLTGLRGLRAPTTCSQLPTCDASSYLSPEIQQVFKTYLLWLHTRATGVLKRGVGESLGCTDRAGGDSPGTLSLTLFFRPEPVLYRILAAAQFPLHQLGCPGQCPRSPRGQILPPQDSPMPGARAPLSLLAHRAI